MAVGVIVKVLSNLIARHGLTRGVKVAQKLGFRNKDIKSAFSKLGTKRKPKTSFKQRKEDRGYAEAMRTDPYFNRRMAPRRGNPFEQKLTKDYMEMTPEQASLERLVAKLSGE